MYQSVAISYYAIAMLFPTCHIVLGIVTQQGYILTTALNHCTMSSSYVCWELLSHAYEVEAVL